MKIIANLQMLFFLCFGMLSWHGISSYFEHKLQEARTGEFITVVLTISPRSLSDIEL